MKNFEKLFRNTMLKGPDDESNLGEEEKLEMKHFNKRKQEILNSLNSQTSGLALTVDNI